MEALCDYIMHAAVQVVCWSYHITNTCFLNVFVLLRPLIDLSNLSRAAGHHSLSFLMLPCESGRSQC